MSLIPITERSENEQRKMRISGGRKSGETRRKKRDARQFVNDMLTAVPDLDKNTIATLKKLGFKVKNDRYTTEHIMYAALIQKAMKGDIRAIDLIHKIMGDYTETINVNVPEINMEEVERFLYNEESSGR